MVKSVKEVLYKIKKIFVKKVIIRVSINPNFFLILGLSIFICLILYFYKNIDWSIFLEMKKKRFSITDAVQDIYDKLTGKVKKPVSPKKQRDPNLNNVHPHMNIAHQIQLMRFRQMEAMEPNRRMRTMYQITRKFFPCPLNEKTGKPWKSCKSYRLKVCTISFRDLVLKLKMDMVVLSKEQFFVKNYSIEWFFWHYKMLLSLDRNFYVKTDQIAYLSEVEQELLKILPKKNKLFKLLFYLEQKRYLMEQKDFERLKLKNWKYK